MTSRRVLKAAEAIREVVSMAILTEIKDPRVQAVTVTYVEVSPDMRTAKVHVSIMGDEAQQRLSLNGLRSAAGFLQRRVSDRIDTRYTPRLQFHLDEGVKKSIRMAEILDNLQAERLQAERDAAAKAGTEPSGHGDAPGDDPLEAPADDELEHERDAPDRTETRPGG